MFAKMIRQKKWNMFDEFSYIRAIKRLPGELNDALRRALLRIGIYPGSSTEQGLTNYLNLRFGLDRYNTYGTDTFLLSNQPVDESVEIHEGDAEYIGTFTLLENVDGTYSKMIQLSSEPSGTLRVYYNTEREDETVRVCDVFIEEVRAEEKPADSRYHDDKIVIMSLADDTYFKDTDYGYINESGVPTGKTEAMVDLLYKRNPLLWGDFRWDQSFWDAGVLHMDTLANLMDASETGFSDNEYHSGIGHGTDVKHELTVYDDTTGQFNPVIRPGYCYIETSGYYVYEEPYAQDEIPVWDESAAAYIIELEESPVLSAPFSVLESGALELDASERIWPVYDHGHDNTNYRMVTDLTGLVTDRYNEISGTAPYTFTFEDGQFQYIEEDYILTRASGYISSARKYLVFPSGAPQMLVTYEIGTSGVFTEDTLDFNPANFPKTQNTFLTVTDREETVSALHLKTISNYQWGPDSYATIEAFATDEYGMIFHSPTISFTTTYGILSAASVVSEKGVARTVLQLPTLTTHGVDDIVVTATANGISSTTTFEPGL